MRRKGIRILEIATVCAVLGIFVSLAVPSVLQMQARSRVDHLLATARSCRGGLPGWLSNALSSRSVASDARVQRGAGGFDVRNILEDFVRGYNERFQDKKPPGDEPLLVVEPTGTLPVYCRRDGRIHLIPFHDKALESVGAKLVVTGQGKNSGPAYDGILAVYEVEPGIE